MIPRIHDGGRGVRGLVAYFTHDPSSAGERRPPTADRVGLVVGPEHADRRPAPPPA